jgi:hypothetical protein
MGTTASSATSTTAAAATIDVSAGGAFAADAWAGGVGEGVAGKIGSAEADTMVLGTILTLVAVGRWVATEDALAIPFAFPDEGSAMPEGAENST